MLWRRGCTSYSAYILITVFARPEHVGQKDKLEKTYRKKKEKKNNSRKRWKEMKKGGKEISRILISGP